MSKVFALALKALRLTKMPFYAVRVGRVPGVYNTWKECKEQVDGVTSRFKKFDTIEEAESFINVVNPSDHKKKPFHVNDGASQTQNNSSSGETSKRGSKRKNVDSSQSDETKKLKPDEEDGPRPIVYTDGCCYFNGRQGAKAGIGVFWGDNHERNLSEPLVGAPTNQRAELNAAIRALETAVDNDLERIEIRTDSIYTMNAMTSWMSSWKKKGFKTAKGEDVKNKEDMIKLDELCQKVNVKWVHVKGHSAEHGNEMADQLAKKGSKSFNKSLD